VKLLNDKFGIQTRGGCSCAGTYGHYLLHVDQETSNDLVCQITSGDLIKKPGWIRMSVHPTTTTEEIIFVCNSINDLSNNYQDWIGEYEYDSKTNEFFHKNAIHSEKEMVSSWFSV
jgi:selenocysteine lyase/cysteine desulfurase